MGESFYVAIRSDLLQIPLFEIGGAVAHLLASGRLFDPPVISHYDLAVTCNGMLNTTTCSLNLLYPRHLCRGYIVFVFPFVCSFVLPSHLWNYFKVLRASNLSGVNLTNHSSESIDIWTIGTLEGRLSFHDPSPQGPCPRVGLEVKI